MRGQGRREVFRTQNSRHKVVTNLSSKEIEKIRRQFDQHGGKIKQIFDDHDRLATNQLIEEIIKLLDDKDLSIKMIASMAYYGVMTLIDQKAKELENDTDLRS